MRTAVARSHAGFGGEPIPKRFDHPHGPPFQRLSALALFGAANFDALHEKSPLTIPEAPGMGASNRRNTRMIGPRIDMIIRGHAGSGIACSSATSLAWRTM